MSWSARFSALVCLLIPATLAFSATWNPDDIGPGGPENCLGLRSAVKLSPTKIRLVFGSSVTGSSTRSSYRLVSETDAYYSGSTARTPSSVSSTNVDDVAYPTGWAGGSYKRYTVDLTFSSTHPMTTTDKYFVQVLGPGTSPVTGGRAAMWVAEVGTDVSAASTTNCLGIRHFDVITNKILKITTGDGVDIAKILPANLVLTCPDDPNFGTAGRAAVQVGRRTRGDCFLCTGWPYGTFRQHELYVVFDQPFVQGKTYSINLNAKAALTCGKASASITISDAANINPAIKVNQLGYLPNAPAKYAYAGDWMGSLGYLNLDSMMTTFKVCNADTNAVVMTGTPTPRRRHQWYLNTNGTRGGPSSAGEGVYHEDYSYEDVWQMDLTSLTTPGDYYVMVPGMGRSFRFSVSANVYAKAFDVAMIGLTHERCGMPMNAPWSPFYRPTCHRNFTTVNGVPNTDLQGGHHDAGDFNPRSHLDVAEKLLEAYSMAPGNFADGQCRVPETGNGVPDILDEARWELDLWRRMRDLTGNGSVFSLIEAPSDPGFTTTGDQDTIKDSAYTTNMPAASMRVAGAWALAAEFYQALGKTADATDLTTRATNAFNWAVANGGLTTANRDSICLGAILMYRRTGTATYRTYFETYTVFKSGSAELDVDQQYDQRLASYYYASCPRTVDATIKNRIISAFNARMSSWMSTADTTGYRYMKHPYAPNNWGSGSYPKWIQSAMEAYKLTGNQNYLKWIILTCDFSLGCNPMNMSWYTRLGQRCISGPLHSNSRCAPNGPIPGMNCEGPSPRTGGETATSDMSTWVGPSLWPIGPWPQLQTYTDWQFVPEMNEGGASDQAVEVAAFGLLLAPAAPIPSVVGCSVFYNNSAWDGNDEAANAADDGAIATDKQPLQPGETASLSNYTSYAKGINGIMVDIDPQGTTISPTDADFLCKTGNTSTPSAWTTKTRFTVTVRPGAGRNGSTRVELTFPDNAIQNTWLQVTVKAGANTGLTGDYVFYFGNAIGETGNSSSSAQVDEDDCTAVRNDPHKTATNPAPITDMCDFNRDKKVNTTDEAISRSGMTSILNELQLISMP